MLPIRTVFLRCCIRMRPFPVVRLTDSSVVCVQHFALVTHVITLIVVIFQSVHGVISTVISIILAKARLSIRTSARAFIVPSQSVATCEFPATFRACMGFFACMEFGVPLQIVQSSETERTSLTHVRLLLTVREKVAFQVVVPRKIGRAVRTFVTLRRFRTGIVAARAGHAHVASRGSIMTP